MGKLRFLMLVLCASILAGCNDNEDTSGGGNVPAGEDMYASQKNWYQTGKSIDPNLCDVFYVQETCSQAWVDENGVTQYYADITNPEQRDRMTARFDEACTIFGDSVNFFAPYSRQVTVDVLMGGDDMLKEKFPKAFEDVKAAFDYYMKHWNNGRKFVVAGYSQGAQCVKELVKVMTQEQYERMVAAYVVGYPIEEEDMAVTNRFVPARGSHDTGVIICCNSANGPEGVSSSFDNSRMVINPVNWSTEPVKTVIDEVKISTTQQTYENVSVALNEEYMTLFVEGIDAESLYEPAMGSVFPLGNYHKHEYDLYGDYLRENVKDRLYQRSKYGSMDNWYRTENINNELCDVFYVVETCTQPWKDENGEIQYYADISRPEQRQVMTERFVRAQNVFGDSANFFTPYYNQVNIGVWLGGEEAVNRYYPKAFAEVKAAFDYYMKHWNNGRKFILAGFSQGAKGVKELVKSMTQEQYDRMVAAYVIGFAVLEEDVASGRFIPAQGSHDTGVTISYNTADNPEGIGIFFKNSQMIINPVNWSTEAKTEILPMLNLNGDTYENVTVTLDKEYMTLFTDGIDPNPFFMQEMSAIFPYGNFHMVELPLYADFLRENVKDRLYQRGK